VNKRQILSLGVTLLATITGCELWRPPVPTPDELARGLVVMYPGVYNTTTEMYGFYTGLRAAGIDQAIEVRPWSLPLINFAVPAEFLHLERPWATTEALRVAQYRRDHPGAPVTLLGYSGGAMIAILVAEELPQGSSVDRVIMMSPGVSTTYDLGLMLDHTRHGAVAYWSQNDWVTNLITFNWGALDGVFGPSAATQGFAMTDQKLTQIEWGPDLAVYGNYGGHADYLFSVDWIRDFVAPWVAR
jgi:pimeloyl-ACP methyl ester carboxylesterase